MTTQDDASKTIVTTTTTNDDQTSLLTNNNLGVLNWQQVNKLDLLLDKPIAIHGRGTYPTLTVRLKDFIRNLNKRLVEQRVRVRDVRINGGVASYVLAHQDDYEFSDIDIIFSCDLLQLNEPTTEFSSLEMAFSNCCDIIKQTVFECLLDYFPTNTNNNNKDNKINSQCLKDAYVKKMIKIYQQSSSNCIETDSTESAESLQSSSRWSLISLCNNQGQNIELKFVDKMKRQFQFSVDAFQIHLASLLKYYDLSSSSTSATIDTNATMNENIYPTVIAESMYGDFEEANYHLNSKLIATKSPEEIRGGGLLKYCNLLVRGFKPVCGGESQMNTMEKYMCSRFFIDFSDLADQEHKLTAYMDCHFQNAPLMCVAYLNKLYQVVNSSTVCLMGHERKQTLNLIESLAKRYQQQNHHHTNNIDEFNNNSNNNNINIYEHLLDNDSESIGSDHSSSSSSLSSSSSSCLSNHQRINNNKYNNNRLNNNNSKTNNSSAASSPCSSSSIQFDNIIFSRSPSNDYHTYYNNNNNNNQMYYYSNNNNSYSNKQPVNKQQHYSHHNHHYHNNNYHHHHHHQPQQQQQQFQQQKMSIVKQAPIIPNKLVIPFSSSSSTSSSVVSSPSPSPPLTAIPINTGTITNNIPFYITITTPTPQQQQQQQQNKNEEVEVGNNNDEQEEENEEEEIIEEETLKKDEEEEENNNQITPTSVFECKIPTEYYPYIEVFNYYSPPVITTTAAASTSSSNASSPVYFYKDPAQQSTNQDISLNNIITRIMPSSKSYQYFSTTNNNDFNYFFMSSKPIKQQQQQQSSPQTNKTQFRQERTDLIVQ